MPASGVTVEDGITYALPPPAYAGETDAAGPITATDCDDDSGSVAAWFFSRVVPAAATWSASDWWAGVVTVSVVDCALAHAAEVYLRADVEVNAAIADVADRECGAGLTRYTGQAVGGGPLAVTYLIDSNQDRTSANPLPSTVICVLTASNGGPLTGSARR